MTIVKCSAIQGFFVLICILILIVPVLADPTIRESCSYTTDGRILSVAASSNGSTIAGGTDSGWVYAIDNDCNFLGNYTISGEIFKVEVTSSGDKVAAVNDVGSFYVFNREIEPLWFAKTEAMTLPGKTTAMAINLNGSAALVGNEYGMLRVFNATGSLRWERMLENRVYAGVISADGNWVTASRPTVFRMFDTNGSESWNSTGYTQHIAMTPDAAIVAAGGGEGSMGNIGIYTNGNAILFEKIGTVNDIAMSYRGTRIPVASEDGNLYIFTRDGALIAKTDLGAPVVRTSISADGNLIAAITNKKIFVLNNTGGILSSFKPEKIPRGVAVSRDGTLVIAAGDDNRFTIYEAVYQAASVPETRIQQTVTTQDTATEPSPRVSQAGVPTANPTAKSSGSGIFLPIVSLGILAVTISCLRKFR